MLARSASLKSSKSSKSSKGKGKAAAKQPRKPKVSNRCAFVLRSFALLAELALVRPRNSPSPAPSSDESASASDDDEDDEQTERARMLAALEAHQQSFLQEALPSTSKLLHVGKGKEKEVKVQKAIWEMDMDDFDDEEAASEEDSDEDEDGRLFRCSVALYAQLNCLVARNGCRSTCSPRRSSIHHLYRPRQSIGGHCRCFRRAEIGRRELGRSSRKSSRYA